MEGIYSFRNGRHCIQYHFDTHQFSLSADSFEELMGLVDYFFDINPKGLSETSEEYTMLLIAA